MSSVVQCTCTCQCRWNMQHVLIEILSLLWSGPEIACMRQGAVKNSWREFLSDLKFAKLSSQFWAWGYHLRVDRETGLVVETKRWWAPLSHKCRYCKNSPRMKRSEMTIWGQIKVIYHFFVYLFCCSFVLSFDCLLLFVGRSPSAYDDHQRKYTLHAPDWSIVRR